MDGDGNLGLGAIGIVNHIVVATGHRGGDRIVDAVFIVCVIALLHWVGLGQIRALLDSNRHIGSGSSRHKVDVQGDA